MSANDVEKGLHWEDTDDFTLVAETTYSGEPTTVEIYFDEALDRPHVVLYEPGRYPHAVAHSAVPATWDAFEEAFPRHMWPTTIFAGKRYPPEKRTPDSKVESWVTDFVAYIHSFDGTEY